MSGCTLVSAATPSRRLLTSVLPAPRPSPRAPLPPPPRPGHGRSHVVDFAASTKKGATTNNKSVKLIKGELVAIAYPTSAKPFGRAQKTPLYGKINTILNPPNRDRHTTYSEHYNATTRTAQSAGGTKLPVPYSMNAFRNRLKDEPPPKSFAGTLNFDMGVANRSTHPYRTVKDAMEAPNTKPLESHVGFTNQCIVSEMSKRFHKTVWAQ